MRVAFRSYAANITTRLMFNQRYFGLERQDGGPTFREEEYVDAIFVALKYAFGFCISDYLPGLVGLDLDGHEKIIKDANRTILKYHEPIIDERIKKWRKAADKDSNGGSTAIMEVEDWLDVLVSTKSSDGNPLLTREEIIAHAKVRTLIGLWCYIY